MKKRIKITVLILMIFVISVFTINNFALDNDDIYGEEFNRCVEHCNKYGSVAARKCIIDHCIPLL